MLLKCIIYLENEAAPTRRESSVPEWISSKELNDDKSQIIRENPRFYAPSKKDVDNAFNLDKTKIDDEFGENGSEELVQRTVDSGQRSRELIPESESEDDGWMMSKRRRVVTSMAAQIPKKVHLTLLFIPFIRWLL